MRDPSDGATPLSGVLPSVFREVLRLAGRGGNRTSSGWTAERAQALPLDPTTHRARVGADDLPYVPSAEFQKREEDGIAPNPIHAKVRIFEFVKQSRS